MSITIRVQSSGDGHSPAERELTFDSPRVVIGRAASCELRLPDPSVSARHLSIRQRGNEHVLIDEGSTNGTRVGRDKLTPQTPFVLGQLTRVRVGRVALLIEIGCAPPTRHALAAAKRIALALIVERLARSGEDARPVVRGPSGEERRLIEGVPLVLGRSREADWVLMEEGCSRRHAELVWRGADVIVRDLGAKAATTVDGDEIPSGQERVWLPGETLTLAGADFTLAFDAPAALAEAEAEADERVPREELELAADPGPQQETPDEEPAQEQDDLPDEEALQAARLELGAARPAPSKPGWSMTDFAVVLLALGVFSLSAVGYLVLLR